MKTEKRSDWHLTKIFLKVFGILLLIDFALLLLVGAPYKGEDSIWRIIYIATTILLLISLAGLASVAFYETTSHYIKKNKENENSA